MIIRYDNRLLRARLCYCEGNTLEQIANEFYKIKFLILLSVGDNPALPGSRVLLYFLQVRRE